jgi:ABC-type Fe3+/spermidine/putrescine transport system ATPase subunit
MNHGVIEQEGTPAEIYDAPASRFVAGFIGSINMLPIEIAGDSVKYLGRTLDLPGELNNRIGVVSAAIRPERLIISSVDSGSNATVISVTYLGATIRYRLAVDAAESTEIIIDASSTSPSHAVGARVNIDFHIGDIRFFSD